MRLLLKDLRWLSPEGDLRGDLRISRGKIREVGRGLVPRRRERVLEAGGFLALPGLVNAHDHLSLNLLPHLGEPPYSSFYTWAEEIYQPERSPIRETLEVPASDRLLWGGYKNLIAGATTVVHHDPYVRSVFRRGFPVRVLERYCWTHSLGFGDDPVRAHRRGRGRPFILHAAEGTDERAHEEIDRLEELGILDRRTVLIHAIALDEARRKKVEAAGAGVVWCSASNLWLYERTAPIPELLGKVPLGLGTDSTLSGSPTLLHELAAAHETGLAGPEELLGLVTTGGARLFGLEDGTGLLAAGGPADLLLLPDTGKSPGEVLAAARPVDLELVAVAGKIHLASERFAEAAGLGPANARVTGRARWLVGDPASLRARIEAVAGSAALSENPLWSILEPVS